MLEFHQDLKNALCVEQYTFVNQRAINYWLAKVQVSIFIERLTKRVFLLDH